MNFKIKFLNIYLVFTHLPTTIKGRNDLEVTQVNYGYDIYDPRDSSAEVNVRFPFIMLGEVC